MPPRGHFEYQAPSLALLLSLAHMMVLFPAAVSPRSYTDINPQEKQQSALIRILHRACLPPRRRHNLPPMAEPPPAKTLGKFPNFTRENARFYQQRGLEVRRSKSKAGSVARLKALACSPDDSCLLARGRLQDQLEHVNGRILAATTAQGAAAWVKVQRQLLEQERLLAGSPVRSSRSKPLPEVQPEVSPLEPGSTPPIDDSPGLMAPAASQSLLAALE